MFKVIAYDLVDVLVTKKAIELNENEKHLEKMFSDNSDNLDYLDKARKIIEEDSIIIETTENLINKLYQVKDKNIFKKIKEEYPTIKQIIATNHVPYIKKFITENLDMNNLDDVIISTEIKKIKPNKEFYNYILRKYRIKPNELLLIDNDKNNMEIANEFGIQTILVNKKTNLENEILIKMLL